MFIESENAEDAFSTSQFRVKAAGCRQTGVIQCLEKIH